MKRHVLVVEPYPELSDLIVDCLADMDLEAVVASAGGVSEADLVRQEYVCALVNLDQNRPEEAETGLGVARLISDRGIPVVMIPDRSVDVSTIEGHGWHIFRKPFTVKDLRTVIDKAVVQQGG